MGDPWRDPPHGRSGFSDWVEGPSGQGVDGSDGWVFALGVWMFPPDGAYAGMMTFFQPIRALRLTRSRVGF